MTIAEFLEEFVEILQTEENVSENTILADLEEWDSMSIMSCMAWFEMNLDTKTSYMDYENLKTVQDVIALAKGKIA